MHDGRSSGAGRGIAQLVTVMHMACQLWWEQDWQQRSMPALHDNERCRHTTPLHRGFGDKYMNDHVYVNWQLRSGT